MSLLITRRASAWPSRGASIAEVLMAALVATLIISVLPVFYFTSLKLWQRESGRLGASERADFSLRRMQKDIRHARRVNISADGRELDLILPKQAYDAEMGRAVNETNAFGELSDGGTVQYKFLQDPYGTGSLGGSLIRRFFHADGSAEPFRVISDGIYPTLNPLAEGTTTPQPVFAYDQNLRAVNVTVTAAEPMPSSATFGPLGPDAKCRRCGGALVRVLTQDHAEGEIHCSQCGAEVEPNAEIATYHTELLLRNQ